jgi:hypothetical protein
MPQSSLSSQIAWHRFQPIYANLLIKRGSNTQRGGCSALPGSSLRPPVPPAGPFTGSIYLHSAAGDANGACSNDDFTTTTLNCWRGSAANHSALPGSSLRPDAIARPFMASVYLHARSQAGERLAAVEEDVRLAGSHGALVHEGHARVVALEPPTPAPATASRRAESVWTLSQTGPPSVKGHGKAGASHAALDTTSYLSCRIGHLFPIWQPLESLLSLGTRSSEGRPMRWRPVGSGAAARGLLFIAVFDAQNLYPHADSKKKRKKLINFFFAVILS